MPPNPDLLVLASTAHPITIRTPVDSKDLVFVAGKILLELAGPHVPDLECGVFTAADQQPTVSAECDLVNGAHMAFEGEEKGAVGSVPELDEVVEAGRGKKQPVGRKDDMVDLLLVAEQAGDGLGRGAGVPEVDGAIVAGRHQALNGLAVLLLAVDAGRRMEALLCLFTLGLFRVGHALLARVVMVCRPQSKVGGEGEMVDPVCVGGKGVQQLAGICHPNLDGLVVRGRVYVAGTTPANARDTGLVSGQGNIGSLVCAVPDAHGAVLGRRGQARATALLGVVRLPRQRRDPLCVAFERTSKLFPGCGIPQAHRVIHAAGCEHLSVRGVAYGEHPASVAGQGMHGGARVAVPYPGSLVTTTGCEARRIGGRELSGEDGVAMAADAGRAPCDGLDSEDGLGAAGDVELDFCARVAGQKGGDDGLVVEIAVAVAQRVVEAVWEAFAGVLTAEQGIQKQREVLGTEVRQRYCRDRPLCFARVCIEELDPLNALGNLRRRDLLAGERGGRRLLPFRDGGDDCGHDPTGGVRNGKGENTLASIVQECQEWQERQQPRCNVSRCAPPRHKLPQELSIAAIR